MLAKVSRKVYKLKSSYDDVISAVDVISNSFNQTTAIPTEEAYGP